MKYFLFVGNQISWLNQSMNLGIQRSLMFSSRVRE